MIEALTLARLCQSLYLDTPGAFDETWNFSGSVFARKRIDDVDVVVARGSLNPLDWLRNAEALPFPDVNIGPVHAGFNVGTVDAVTQISLACGPKIVLTGHSLGGARARILAARFAHAGVPALQCTVFASPKPGFHPMCQILRDSATWHSSYRDMSCLITEVPTIDPRWEHPEPYAQLHAEADPGDNDMLFRYHHIGVLIRGLEMLGATELAAATGATP